MSRNKEHRPIGGAAEGGASAFFVSVHFCYIMNLYYGYSLYIAYIFHFYIRILACVLCVCVLDLLLVVDCTCKRQEQKLNLLDKRPSCKQVLNMLDKLFFENRPVRQYSLLLHRKIQSSNTKSEQLIKNKAADTLYDVQIM